MIKRLLKLVVIGLLLPSCNSNKQENDSEETAWQVSGIYPAEGSYLTRDHKGNPVVVWTEGESDSSGIFLYYAVLEDGRKTFSTPIKVESSKGTRFHAESMNKVAFKDDGTVIAVFEKRFPTEKNPFAGAIFYSQSFDKGKSWTDPKYLHTDTSAETGRSFFDLVTLPNGEVGAAWLDGRLKLGKKGSSVFYASTSGKDGFTTDKQIGETICQCCRTDLYTDSEGVVHAVFRDIINDSIRDMVHCYSLDTGKTFSQPERISADNWVIDGCPHTGPDIVRTKEGLHFTWFTAGGSAGVYYCNSPDLGKTFKERELVNSDGRHPRIAALEDKVIIVWDEMVSQDSTYYPRIGMQIRNGSKKTTKYLSTANVSAYFPQVLMVNKDSVLISWTEEEDKKKKVVYKIVKL